MTINSTEKNILKAFFLSFEFWFAALSPGKVFWGNIQISGNNLIEIKKVGFIHLRSGVFQLTSLKTKITRFTFHYLYSYTNAKFMFI